MKIKNFEQQKKGKKNKQQPNPTTNKKNPAAKNNSPCDYFLWKQKEKHITKMTSLVSGECFSCYKTVVLIYQNYYYCLLLFRI